MISLQFSSLTRSLISWKLQSGKETKTIQLRALFSRKDGKPVLDKEAVQFTSDDWYQKRRVAFSFIIFIECNIGFSRKTIDRRKWGFMTVIPDHYKVARYSRMS